MRVAEFELERFQSLYEHRVDFNLAESGVDPLTAGDLVDEDGMRRLLELPLGYAQTNGPPELRELIGEHLGVPPRNVLVTSATIEANFICAWRLVSPGDEVAYMVPNYLQVGGLAESFGAVVKSFHCTEENGWQPDLEELESVVSPRTRMVALVNPSNPTGVVLSPTAMARIVELARSAGAWLLADEIYRGTEHAGEPTPSFWGAYDRVIVTGSLSKAYGLPGLRIGWVVAPEPLVGELWARKDYTSITAATLSYELAVRALQPEVTRRILHRNRDLVVRNLEVLREWTAADERLSIGSPTAAAMTLVRYRHDIPSAELADRLYREKSVLVVPGAHFGLEGYLRIGYGVPTKTLLGGLARIDELLAELPG